MRNFKKVVALVLALAMVLSMNTVTFAAEMTAAEKAETLMLLKGDGNGVTAEYLAKVPLRIQAAIISLRLAGLEDEATAYEGTEEFADNADVTWAAGQNVLSYLKANPDLGWQGDGTNFMPNEPVSAQQFVKVMLEVLGYVQGTDFEYADVFTFAATVGLTALTADSVMTNDSLAVGMVDALAAETAAGGTLLDKLIADEVITEELAITAGLKEAAPAELAVVSVTATNLIELVVVYNKEVDETTATDIANYTMSDGEAVASATLAADGKTVNLVLADGNAQQASYDIDIEDVEDTDENVIADTTVEGITFFDATVPTAVSIELTGPTTFEVTYSEVMDTQVANNPTVLVNDGIYGASFNSWDGKVAKFDLSAELTDGTDYTVKVSGGEDEATFSPADTVFTLAYIVDATAPTVEVTSATQTQVKFTFSKAVKNLEAANFYHTFTGWTALSIEDADGNAIATTDYETVVVAIFATDASTGHPLVAGANTVGVTKGDTDSEITDLWGNDLAADVTFPVTVSADTTAPTVVSVEATDEDEIEIVVSESVTTATAEDEGNYTIYDADGDEVSTSFTAAYVDADKKITLTFTSDLAAGTYTVEIEDLVDTSIYANEVVTVTKTITISDLTAVASMSGEVVDGTGEYFIYITFPENMNTATTLDLANYRLDGAAFADTTTIAQFGDAKNVKITVVADPDGKTVTAANLIDAAGNEMDSFDVLSTGALANASAPEVTGIKTVGLQKIEVTFDAHLSAAPAAAFKVNNETPASVTYVNTTDDSDNPIATVTMNLKEVGKLTGEGDTTVLLEIIADTVKSFTGALAVSTVDGADTDANTGSVTDGIAPAFATTAATTYDLNGNGQIDTIVVAYTEDIESDTVSLLTYDVDGYTETAVVVSGEATPVAASTDATTGDGMFIVITVTESGSADTDATPDVTQVYAIKDVAGNSLAAQSAVGSTDTAAPVLLSAVNTTGEDTLVLTFSEPVTGGTAATAATLALADLTFVDNGGAGATDISAVPATATSGVETVTVTLDAVTVAGDLADTVNAAAGAVLDLADNAADETDLVVITLN